MPTDHGLPLVKPPASLAEQTYAMSVTGPQSLEEIRGPRWEWDST